jgi:alpha-aminoadipate/glutamate carrier protein LysW
LEDAMAICPECEAPIDIEENEIEEGQTLDCPECGAELEVVSTNPVELDLIEEEDEEEKEREEESW